MDRPDPDRRAQVDAALSGCGTKTVARNAAFATEWPIPAK